MVLTIPHLKCEACGHRWMPRKTEITKCPRCQSRKWNEKQKKKKSA